MFGYFCSYTFFPHNVLLYLGKQHLHADTQNRQIKCIMFDALCKVSAATA